MKYLACVFFVIFACTLPPDTNSIGNFRLVYRDDTDRIDFSGNTVTMKRYGSDQTFRLKIDDKSKRRILKFIMNSDVLLIDESQLKYNCEFYILPAFSSELEISIDNGDKKKFRWTTDNCSAQINDLNKLASLIKEETIAKIPKENLPPKVIWAE